MSDLDVLFPGREVVVGGETITVKPLAFGQLPKAAKLLQPVVKALRASGAIGGEGSVIDLFGSWVDMLAAGGEELLALVGFAIGKPREWFDGLSMDDGVALVRAAVEVNGDFFGRKVLPMLTGVADGVMSSEPSSQPGTAEPTSTDTP